MSKVGVAELKARLSQYLRRVKNGEEVGVYDRNEPVARLVPWSATGALVVREPRRRYKTLGDIKLPPPAKLEVDAVKLLLEDRNSGR
jgi:prevent-host-death family protein